MLMYLCWDMSINIFFELFVPANIPLPCLFICLLRFTKKLMYLNNVLNMMILQKILEKSTGKNDDDFVWHIVYFRF